MFKQTNVLTECFFSFLLTAAMGGLLSLGLGMSFISIVELFYFMFMRGFCYLRFSSESDQSMDLTRTNTTIPLSFTNRGFVTPTNSNN